MSRSVLVTGAAGSVGREVLAALLDRRGDWRVKAFDLPTVASRRALRPFRREARVIFGDLRCSADVAVAVEGVDAVIHLAAVIPPRADAKPALARSVNVGGTARLVEAMKRSPRRPRLLHTSSISVYGDRVATPWIRVQDELRPSPHDHYAETKIEGERLVQGSGLSWTIFRLSAVMRPEMKMDPLMFHMPLGTSLEIVTARDCGYALVRALDVEGLEGSVYNLGGGPACRTTYRELLDEALRRFGLGEGFFPEEAFASGNFHCGYYQDSDELEALLGFQREGLVDWLNQVSEQVNPVQRALTVAVRPLIRPALLVRSEPYRARRGKDRALLERFCPQP